MTYEESSDINFSKLSALIKGVDYYKKFIKEDMSEPYLSFGSASHHFFLENDIFNDKYVVFKENKPSNAKHKTFCVMLSQQDKMDTQTRVECYKAVFATKSKKEDDIKQNSVKLYIQFKDYIDFLKQAQSRYILSEADFLKIKTFESKFKRHKGIMKLLYDKSDDLLEFNELPIFFTYSGEKCKSKLDRLLVDTRNKKVYIIDLKTHSTKSLSSNIRQTFHKSVLDYNYRMQQAMYYLAATDFIKNKLEFDPDQFEFIPVFILMQSNFLNSVKLIRLSQDELYEGIMDVKGALELYKFHCKNGFDFDRDYYEDELGFEELAT